jgi:hypothetical protein
MMLHSMDVDVVCLKSNQTQLGHAGAQTSQHGAPG